MFKTKLRHSILTFTCAGMLSVASFAMTGQKDAVAAAPQSSDLDRAQIEKIIHDYIVDHPEVILQSVENYQKQSTEERQKVALKEHADRLFNDETTPVAGNPKGDVTVIEFFDYNCGYCKRAWPNLEKLMDNDKNVRVLFKELPILGEASELAARWALAAEGQGKYLEFHKELLESRGALNEDKLKSIAEDLGLNPVRMKQDAQSDAVTKIIQKNRSLAVALDITGTPAFLVEDTIIPGAISYDQLNLLVKDKRKQKEGDKKTQ